MFVYDMADTYICSSNQNACSV